VRKEFQKWHGGRPWLTNVMLCLLGYGLMMMARQFIAETDHFTIGFSGVSGWSAILYMAAVAVILTQPVDRKTVWIVLGWALAMRAMMLFEQPYLSSDIYRYVWDGVVQHAGVNPYRYVPGDQALAYLRAPNQPVFDNINRRDYARTIYPPVAQMVYWLATFFEPTVQGMKAAMFAFECVTAAAIVAMLRRMGRPIAEVLMYAWCPLLVWEIAGAGHVDAAVYAFVMLALLFRFREQPVWVGFFLGCAVMTKFYPLVLLPALWKRGDWKMPAVLASVCAVGYAMYSSVGMLVFGFLGGYSKEEGLDTGARYFPLDWIRQFHRASPLPTSVYLVFCALVLGGIALWCWKHATVATASGSIGAPAFVKGSMMLALAMMLLFSPHYAWYIAWLIPLMALWPNWATMAYVCVFFYGFTTRWADGTAVNMFLLNGWVYRTVLLGLLIGVAWSRGDVGRWFGGRRVVLNDG
jgi:alpha-1,6-mannosyltransferase